MVGRPLRIGLVVERFEPHGGVEHVAWEVSHRLAAAGDEVHVFCRSTVEPARKDTVGLLEVHRLRVPKTWQPLRVLAFSRAAAAAARSVSPDVVQSFSRTRYQDIYRAGGGCHASYMERAYTGSGRSLRRLSPRHAVLLGIEAAIFADPSQIVLCNSPMVEREIAERHGVPPERLEVLTNGVDLERFDPALRASRREPVRSAEAAGSGPVWLLAGHGFARKGVDTALRALAESRSEGILWVAGGDDPKPWKTRAERYGVGGRVRFLGNRDDLPDLLAAADALILPTRYDAFANVCLEAAAAGVPVVTSAANGAASLLGDAALVIAEAQDASAFATALDRLADVATREQMGRLGRKIAEAMSWDQHVASLRALYRRIPR